MVAEPVDFVGPVVADALPAEGSRVEGIALLSAAPSSDEEYALENARLPGEFLLATLATGALRVSKPFRVIVYPENDDFIACATELKEFGFGKSHSEAVRDLQNAISQLFASLETDEARLGPDLQKLLRKIRRHLVHRP